jgi:hypothetical protein
VHVSRLKVRDDALRAIDPEKEMEHKIAKENEEIRKERKRQQLEGPKATRSYGGRGSMEGVGMRASYLQEGFEDDSRWDLGCEVCFVRLVYLGVTCRYDAVSIRDIKRKAAKSFRRPRLDSEGEEEEEEDEDEGEDMDDFIAKSDDEEGGGNGGVWGEGSEEDEDYRSSGGEEEEGEEEDAVGNTVKKDKAKKVSRTYSQC